MIGIVDVLDIVLFVIGLFPKEISLDNLSEEDVKKVIETGEKFEKALIGDVFELSGADCNIYLLEQR